MTIATHALSVLLKHFGPCEKDGKMKLAVGTWGFVRISLVDIIRTESSRAKGKLVL